MTEIVRIAQLDTGVAGLNDVLGGGMPEFSFNLLAGGPGAGKTTLALQMCFALATPERPALYVTVLGEPPIKLLRYQQQFAFFDPAKVNRSVHFVAIDLAILEEGLGKVLERIIAEVEERNPSVVVVDSFRSISRAQEPNGELSLQAFVQRLALKLTTWQATTFLVGEYQNAEREDNPVFTVADGIIWLTQSVERNSIVRKLQVVKMRGQAPIPGLQTFRITTAGVEVFPRIPLPKEVSMLDQLTLLQEGESDKPLARVSTGVSELDRMMGGGIPKGSSLLVAGSSGSGKAILSMQFIAEGVKHGEPGLLAVFEKRPSDYLQSSPLGREVGRQIRDGTVHILYLRPLDLTLDETLQEVRAMVLAHGIKRIVIDSLSGLELALAPGYREDFRETLHRMSAMLTAMGVTLLLTVEMVDSYIDLRFSPHGTAFLTDGILLMRYIELKGQFKRMLSVVKLRGSQHSKDIRLYDITTDGLMIGDGLPDYEGLMSGTPSRVENSQSAKR